MPNEQKKILLIEDDPTQVMIYELEFKSHGHELIIATGGYAGLEKAKEEKPDLILLDLLMGDIGGLDVLKKLKEDTETENIRVIIFSNFTKKGLEEECKEAGAIDYWVKSKYEPKEVVAKTEKYLS